MTKGLLFIIGIIALNLVACATLQLPANQTAEQTRMAMCQDAMVGMAIGQAFVNDPNAISGGIQNLEYWRRWVRGAEIAIQAYCTPISTIPPVASATK